jgi:hypothetical protein
MPLPGRPGLRNTRVVPQGWEQHHRPVSEDAMPAVCLIQRQSSTTTAWDDAAGKDVFVPASTVYDGPCRVHAAAAAAAATVVDRQLALAAYVVTIPAESDRVQAGDLIKITECEGDPALVDIPLIVTGATRSALTWERVIQVQMQQPVTR